MMDYYTLRCFCYEQKNGGFLRCPISKKQFLDCRQLGLSMEQILSVCCDVYSGVSLHEAIFWNMSCPVPFNGKEVA